MKNFLFSQLITFAASWVIALCYLTFGGEVHQIVFYGFAMIFMWVPGIVAIYFYKTDNIELPLRFSWNKSYAFANILALLLLGFTVLFCIPFFEMRSMHDIMSIAPAFIGRMHPELAIVTSFFFWIIVALVLGYTLNLILVFGIEFMWRGYAWEKLKRYGFFQASLISGACWGLWYAPLILMGMNYPEQPFWGILWMILSCILLSPILMYLRVTSQNIYGSSIFHGLINALANLTVILFYSNNHLLLGMQGLTGFAACIILNLIIWLKIKKDPYLLIEL